MFSPDTLFWPYHALYNALLSRQNCTVNISLPDTAHCRSLQCSLPKPRKCIFDHLGMHLSLSNHKQWCSLHIWWHTAVLIGPHPTQYIICPLRLHQFPSLTLPNTHCSVPAGNEPPPLVIKTQGLKHSTLHTALHCTSLPCYILHCTALYCTALYCTALHWSILHSTALYCTTLHCPALYFTARPCTALHYTALPCSILHCTVLHHTVLYSTSVDSTVLRTLSRGSCYDKCIVWQDTLGGLLGSDISLSNFPLQ